MELVKNAPLPPPQEMLLHYLHEQEPPYWSPYPRILPITLNIVSLGRVGAQGKLHIPTNKIRTMS